MTYADEWGAHGTRKTRRQAGEEIQSSATVLRAQVAHFIKLAPEGCTDQEIQLGLNMAGSTERPRRGELLAEGYIKDAGFVRKTTSGRNAVVWVYVWNRAEQISRKDALIEEKRRQALITALSLELADLSAAELERLLTSIRRNLRDDTPTTWSQTALFDDPKPSASSFKLKRRLPQ